jgi:hypothetical protein
MELTFSFSVEFNYNEKWLCIKSSNNLWGDFKTIDLFGDLAEALVSSSYGNICYDLSNVSTVSSHMFGICFNIANKAVACNKKVKFRLNKTANETAIIANFHKRVVIEVG